MDMITYIYIKKICFFLDITITKSKKEYIMNIFWPPKYGQINTVQSGSSPETITDFV